MTVTTLELGGRRWAILPEKEYRILAAQARLAAAGAWPELPAPDAKGRYPAVEYARASLARKLIKRRRAAGLTQAELARRASVRPETLNRIEKGRTAPDVATIAKLERALEEAQPEADWCPVEQVMQRSRGTDTHVRPGGRTGVSAPQFVSGLRQHDTSGMAPRPGRRISLRRKRGVQGRLRPGVTGLPL